MKFVVLLFRGPFWVQLVLAAGMVGLGLWMQAELRQAADARAALLAQAPPATVPITEAMGAARGSKAPIEVSVSAEIALGENTRLVEKRNFITTGETLMYVLFAPGAPEGTKVAQAAILLDPADLDAFAAWSGERMTDIGVHGPIVTIDGLKTASGETSHARKAMDEHGLTLADGFFFIEPFLKGREAGLAAPPPGSDVLYVFFGIAGFFALIAALKVIARRRPAPVAPALPAGLDAVADDGTAEAPPPAGPAREGPAEAIAVDLANNPIAALKAKAAARAAEQAAPPPAEAPVAKAPRKPRSLHGTVALALVAVAAAAAAFGRWEVFGLLPLVIMGYAYFGLYKGSRAIGRAATGLAEKHLGVPRLDEPLPQPAPRAAPAVARAADGFDAGPVKSAPRFSLGALIPQRKAKAPEGPDPFDRLTAMVAAERRREAMQRMMPAQ